MKISKKVWLSALAGIVLASGVSAQSITLTNIFGGNADNLYSSDFITLEKDEDGKLNKVNVNVADRLQLDFKGDKILGRVRLEGKTNTTDGKFSSASDGGADLRIRGFIGFNPWEFLTIAGGNSFFSKYSLSAAYLAASDDQESHGNLLGTFCVRICNQYLAACGKIFQFFFNIWFGIAKKIYQIWLFYHMNLRIFFYVRDEIYVIYSSRVHSCCIEFKQGKNC